MTFEPVHTVETYWDGVRSGTADFAGAPHYFDCRFDEDEDAFCEIYDLYPVDAAFMARARRLGDIFAGWAERYLSGAAKAETHPASGGVDAEHDDLKRWMEDQVRSLEPLREAYKATFRIIAGQEDTPPGVMRGLEVAWTRALDQGQAPTA